jgi:hypothetical protein
VDGKPIINTNKEGLLKRLGNGLSKAKDAAKQTWASTAKNLNGVKTGMTAEIGTAANTAGKASALSKGMAVGGKVIAVAGQVYSIGSEINENWGDLSGGDPDKVAVAQTKVAIMASGGFLVKGLTDLTGMGVGLFNKEAGQQVTDSYDQIAGAIANSPVKYAYKASNWVVDSTVGSDTAAGKVMDNGAEAFGKSKVGAWFVNKFL